MGLRIKVSGKDTEVSGGLEGCFKGRASSGGKSGKS